MGKKRLKVATVLSVLALGSITLVQTPSATAATGTIPLSQVLNIANPALDGNWNDFDILTGAINFVLKEKPTSAVAVLADGSVALTAFAPTDRAFRNLVKALNGKFPYTEAATLGALAKLGATTIEKVLLYHVIVGDPITSDIAITANGAALKMAQTESVTVKVLGKRIYLQDIGLPTITPKVIMSGVDLNLGNKQIAHAIDAVLIPTL